jgi:hypothetical protein
MRITIRHHFLIWYSCLFHLLMLLLLFRFSHKVVRLSASCYQHLSRPSKVSLLNSSPVFLRCFSSSHGTSSDVRCHSSAGPIFLFRCKVSSPGPSSLGTVLTDPLLEVFSWTHYRPSFCSSLSSFVTMVLQSQYSIHLIPPMLVLVFFLSDPVLHSTGVRFVWSRPTQYWCSFWFHRSQYWCSFCLIPSDPVLVFGLIPSVPVLVFFLSDPVRPSTGVLYVWSRPTQYWCSLCLIPSYTVLVLVLSDPVRPSTGVLSVWSRPDPVLVLILSNHILPTTGVLPRHSQTHFSMPTECSVASIRMWTLVSQCGSFNFILQNILLRYNKVCVIPNAS